MRALLLAALILCSPPEVLAGPAFSASYLATDPGAVSVAIGDVNEDGHPDLVTAESRLLPGVGDGTFQAPIQLPLGSTVDIAIENLNGDAHPDLVGVSATGNAILILLGTGGGGFDPVHEESTGTVPRKIAVGDLDGDGKPDLVVATAAGASVHMGLGNGTFEPYATFGSPSERVIVADLNEDGAPDLAGDGTGLWIALGKGDGAFGPPQTVQAGCSGLAAAAGDVDGDGWLDLAAVMCQGPVQTEHEVLTGAALFYGVGDGTFVPGPYQPPDVSYDPPDAVAMADVNGDGLADITTIGSARGECGLFIAYGEPDRGPLPRQRHWAGEPGGIAVADLNHDAHTDIVVAAGRVKVLLGNGDGSFGDDRSLYYSTFGVAFGAIAAGDIDNDSLPDLVVSKNECCGVDILPGLGDGTFASGYRLDDVSGRPFAIADINQDGLNDLVTSAVSILHGLPNGTLGTEVTFPGSADSVDVGDQNGDGFSEVVVRGPRLHSVLFGNGTGGYGSELVFTGLGAGSAVADLNGDSLPDSLAVTGWEVGAWLRDSAGVLDPAGDYGGAGTTASLLALGDFNHDERLDVAVVRNTPSKAAADRWISILLNQLNRDVTTAVLISLAAAKVENGAAYLDWFAPGAPALACRLFRSSGGAWELIGSVAADGTGHIVYVDRAVDPGRRYGYRLGIADGGVESYLGEAWVDVPVQAFSLAGVVPNPAFGLNCVVRFTLPTSEPATLELFDPAGRRLASKSVGSLGVGMHRVDLADRLTIRPGLYVVRLSQGGRFLAKKAVLLP